MKLILGLAESMRASRHHLRRKVSGVEDDGLTLTISAAVFREGQITFSMVGASLISGKARGMLEKK